MDKIINRLLRQAEKAKKTGNYIEEINAYQKLYDLYKHELGEKHPDTLNALGNLGNAYSKIGDYHKALEIANTVYITKKDIFGENDSDTLNALENLAISYSVLGGYKKALELEEEVYDARKQILGQSHPDTLYTLSNIAGIYCNLGDYNKALELTNSVYDAMKDIFGENHPNTIKALSSVAVSFNNLGFHNKALEVEKAVYTRRKEILGENHPETLRSLANLASTYSDLGDYGKALGLKNIVYNARKEILGDNHPDTLSSLANLAISYSDLGEYSKACELQKIVYNARKEILGENHPDTLSALHNLANSYSDLGDYSKACELQKIVYNAFKEILGDNHPSTLRVLGDLGITYKYLGNDNKAFELQNTVYNTRKEIHGEGHPDTLIALSNILASQIDQEEEKNQSISKHMIAYAYEKLQKLLKKKHFKKLLVLSNLQALQIHQEEANNQSIKKYITAYFENIDNLKATAFGIKEVSSRRNFLDSFSNVYKLLKTSSFERNIKDLLDYLFINKNLSFEIDVNRFHNETMSERLSLEEVSHAISNHLIIDFYELDNLKYGLILIKNGKYSQYVADYSDIINGSFKNDEDIQSFIGSFDDYDHIYICPDGELYNVSFERVLNYSNISYLSSVQTLFKKNTDDDNTDQLVSFVYPDFSGRLSDDNDRGDKKGVLYGSYLEGMFIQDIYGEKSIIYRLNQANHDNFLNTKRPRILHVSTHGDYLDNENMEPMDRGILCLSGYNIDENNSGYISAREIQYMDLKGTELVVLSACNTGLGENISGEGIYGIRRAFELAGCQTLLLTVEEVDDFNSAIFMKVFYERYNETNNIYQSFKDTKEYLKEHGLKELRELRDVFEEVMKNKINSRIVYTRNLKELNRRIEESEMRGQIVRKKNGEYVVEDWNGFIIQGKIENS